MAKICLIPSPFFTNNLEVYDGHVHTSMFRVSILPRTVALSDQEHDISLPAWSLECHSHAAVTRVPDSYRSTLFGVMEGAQVWESGHLGPSSDLAHIICVTLIKYLNFSLS